MQSQTVTTYELKIDFLAENTSEKLQTKQDLAQWLIGTGEESFVDGIIDDVDIDFEYGMDDRDFFGEAGGDYTSLVLYKYDKHYLDSLESRILEVFSSRVSCQRSSLDTQLWQEGWKASFSAFETEQFFVYPPWEENLRSKTCKIPLEIEPGMAFGTGQHATTQLCLREIENFSQFDLQHTVIDVGTGTGILAIALSKLGCKQLIATDTDPDALVAAARNAEANQVDLRLVQGSIPDGVEPCSLVVANILAVVLKKIFPDLIRATRSGGYILLSGILDEERLEMRAIGESLGLEYIRHREQDSWVSLLFRRV